MGGAVMSGDVLRAWMFKRHNGSYNSNWMPGNPDMEPILVEIFIADGTPWRVEFSSKDQIAERLRSHEAAVEDALQELADDQRDAPNEGFADDLYSALKLALEYWNHRQRRYKNRHPVWVEAALSAIDKADGKNV